MSSCFLQDWLLQEISRLVFGLPPLRFWNLKWFFRSHRGSFFAWQLPRLCPCRAQELQWPSPRTSVSLAFHSLNNCWPVCTTVSPGAMELKQLQDLKDPSCLSTSKPSGQAKLKDWEVSIDVQITLTESLVPLRSQLFRISASAEPLWEFSAQCKSQRQKRVVS